MKLRSAAKALAYYTGAMDLLHRFRGRECLTVVMFHRVLPVPEHDRLQADPLYTVTPQLLADIVQFLKRNYAIVGLKDVLCSRRRERPLPNWPALITFDDGWRDNLDWALPVLRGIPWTLFAATDAVSEPECWWQEALLWALRSGGVAHEDLMQQAALHEAEKCFADSSKVQANDASGWRGTQPANEVLSILLRYSVMSADQRGAALAPYEAALRRRYNGPQMLSADDLRALDQVGVSIAAHGAAHVPLSHAIDPEGDLQRARAWLNASLGPTDLPAMSFPHGRYDERALAVARGLGYELLFTSDAVLGACPSGWLASDVIGRISVATQDVEDDSGGLAPHRMAAWLYMRDRGGPWA